MKTTASITAAVALAATLVGAAMANPADDSGDQRLRIIAAGYSRAMLDRGGWSNPWVAGGHYAAGEPLQAVAVGSGVTTRFAADGADRSASPRTAAGVSKGSEGS